MHSNHPNVGNLLLVGVPGPELSPETAALYRKLQPGGFILFGRNIQSPAQVRKLLDDLRDLCRHEPILTIDQEGGRVARLKLIGNEPPSVLDLRIKNDPELIQWHGRLTGRLLRLFGFNLNLCPVLDIGFDEEADNSLRGRCFGATPEEVISKSRLFHKAMTAEGIAGCGKHFPGYTFAEVDPHHDLPEVARSREELEATELLPFRALCNELASMMIGHALYPALESADLPASLSRSIIKGFLIEEMGFDGLIMTDDLDMGAIYHRHPLAKTLPLALEAGNHLLMICHQTEVIEEAGRILSKLKKNQLDSALQRMARFQSEELSPPTQFSEETFHRLDQEVWDLRVAVMGAERAAQRSPEDGKRSPVEIY